MVKITILNDIVHSDFLTSLDIQKSWGIEVLDLRNHIFGKSFLDLREVEMELAVQSIAEREMSVYCLSSGLFFDEVEKGEAYFRDYHLGQVDRLIQAANHLKPNVVRLLSACTEKRTSVKDSISYISKQYSWLFDVYREAIDRIHAAGHHVTIENEVRGCILSTPKEIMDFFQILNREDKASFTFDVQNLWKMGTFPTMDVYHQLSYLIGYYHLKGGKAADDSRELVWSSSLEDASWPVVEMTTALVEDGRSSVICLNPSHGEIMAGYSYEGIHLRNLNFLRDHGFGDKE